MIKVLPSRADPTIKEFDLPHFIYVDHDALGPAHTSMMNPRNAEVFRKVWICMLTGKAP